MVLSSVSLTWWLVVVMVSTGTAPFCSLAKAQPVNDNCTEAITFTAKADPTEVITGSTIGSNVGPSFGIYCVPLTTISPTVFYSFQGTGTRITLSTCSASTNFATAITLGSACGVCIAGSDGDLACTTTANAAAMTFDSEMSKTYIVVIYGRQPGLEGNFGLNALEYIPPLNNNCYTSSIPFRPVVTKETILTGSTVNGTVGPSFGIYCVPLTTISPTVFYSFEGTGTRITLSTCSASTNFATAITLGGACGVCITSSDGDLACATTANAAAITFDSEMSKTYTVVIYGRQAGLEGNFGLTALEYIPPPNNLCANAINVLPGSKTVGYTVNATVGPDLGIYTRPNTNVCPTVWYSVLGNGNLFKATTCSDMTNYDTAITVTEVSSGCGSGLLSSNVDLSCSINSGASAVSWNTTLGTRYYIAVHGRAKGNEGHFELIVMDMNNPVAPGPVPQPVSAVKVTVVETAKGTPVVLAPPFENVTTAIVLVFPENAGVTVNEDGSITFVPDDDFEGKNTVVAEFCNADNACATRSYTLNVTNESNQDQMSNKTWLAALAVIPVIFALTGLYVWNKHRTSDGQRRAPGQPIENTNTGGGQGVSQHPVVNTIIITTDEQITHNEPSLNASEQFVVDEPGGYNECSVARHEQAMPEEPIASAVAQEDVNNLENMNVPFANIELAKPVYKDQCRSDQARDVPEAVASPVDDY